LAFYARESFVSFTRRQSVVSTTTADFVDAPAPTLTEDLNYKLQLEKMKIDFEFKKLEREIEREVKLAELQTSSASTSAK